MAPTLAEIARILPGGNPPPGAVAILGAGASADSGAPTVARFQQQASRTYESMLRGGWDPRIQNLYGVALQDWRERAGGANIEEFYQLCELTDRLGQTGPINLKPSNARLLIAVTLQDALRAPKENPPDDFVTTFLATWSLFMGHSAIISLNWDILVDQALRRAGADIDYGLARANALDQAPIHEPPTPRVKLLKLHGSLNWLHCKDCNGVFFDPNEKFYLAETLISGTPCPGCTEGHASVFFVPPTSHKLGDDKTSPLLHVWAHARAALRNCRELFIIGYSFPETDSQFRTMITEAVATNPFLEHITVVTSEKHGTRKMAFEDRVSTILREKPAHAPLRFYYKGFGTWLAGHEFRSYHAAVTEQQRTWHRRVLQLRKEEIENLGTPD